MNMNDQRRILACSSLVLVWTSGCADPCVDDGLIQDPNAPGCPGLSDNDATDGPEPTTTTDDDDSGPEPSCFNGTEDGDETDVDCGGSCGDDCGTGQGCEDDDDCTSAECGAGMTCEDPPSCDNGIQDGDETDLDCGGSCPPCADGEICQDPGDCVSDMCEDGICDPPICRDGILNGDETDLDCGGSCPPCANGDMCIDGTDCQSGACADGTCDDSSCVDGVHNGEETDVDCGGPDCDPCDDGEDCLEDSDCSSQQCDPQNDTCLAPSCTDGIINGDETDLDCGGACGATCDPGEACIVGMDCLSFGCAAGTNVCNDFLSVNAAPSCSNYAEAPVGLTATAAGGSGVYSYAWTPNDGSLTTPDQAMTDAGPSSFQSYLVTVDDGFNSAQDSVVVVNSLPFDLQSNCTTTSANYGVSSSGADASITYDMGGTRGCENGNNEFGLTLCETVVFENTRLRGTLEVLDTGEAPPDNDWVGLVWGAQDNSHFYSMIWKQSFQSGAGFSPPLPCDTLGGILVRRIEGPDFASLTGADFFCVENTVNSTLLADPTATTSQGWALDESYSVTIDFTDAGSAVTVVRDSDLAEMANFLVADTTYTTGYFGSTTASQQGACVGPLYAECL
jgi:Thrombospondin C-terminal region